MEFVFEGAVLVKGVVSAFAVEQLRQRSAVSIAEMHLFESGSELVLNDEGVRVDLAPRGLVLQLVRL